MAGGGSSAGWEAVEVSNGIVLLGAEVDGSCVIWEVAIVNNCNVLLAAEVDGISGGGVV